ncbi:unnamed protein product [Linum trigynum]|uniref:Uncharacterized protein n=1 Tax=Linum trigynum TaxID=586398 RepID=A0AAV2F9G6_9ROSI
MPPPQLPSSPLHISLLHLHQLPSSLPPRSLPRQVVWPPSSDPRRVTLPPDCLHPSSSLSIHRLTVELRRRLTASIIVPKRAY